MAPIVDKMTIFVAGVGLFLLLFFLATLASLACIFGEVSTNDAVIMATDLFIDTFTKDTIVMTIVSGLAYGLLPSRNTTFSSSFVHITLTLLIIAAVPVMAMPVGVKQGGALAAGGSTALIVAALVATTTGKRRKALPSNECRETKNCK